MAIWSWFGTGVSKIVTEESAKKIATKATAEVAKNTAKVVGQKIAEGAVIDAVFKSLL